MGRLRIWLNIKSAWGTVSASCFLLRIGLRHSKNNHSHTCSLHHKQSDVNDSTCACVQCISAAHAHQCKTGTSKQTRDNRMAFRHWRFCVVLLWHKQSSNNKSYIHLSLRLFLRIKKVVWPSWHKSIDRLQWKKQLKWAYKMHLGGWNAWSGSQLPGLAIKQTWSRIADKVKDKSIKHRLCREQSYKISLGHICFDRIGWNWAIFYFRKSIK